MCYPTPNAKPCLIYFLDFSICYATCYTIFNIFFERYREISYIMHILLIDRERLPLLLKKLFIAIDELSKLAKTYCEKKGTKIEM